MVRVIRTFKPDIVINGWGGVRSGHGNHQASGFLTPKAVELAADPKAYPDKSQWRRALESGTCFSNKAAAAQTARR